ncbi:phosphotransferase [Nonomuraea montanisoli]
MGRWVRHLAGLSLPVVTPLAGPHRIAGDDWVAYPWIDGRGYDGSPADIRAAGDLLGRLHAACTPPAAPRTRPDCPVSRGRTTTRIRSTTTSRVATRFSGSTSCTARPGPSWSIPTTANGRRGCSTWPWPCCCSATTCRTDRRGCSTRGSGPSSATRTCVTWG